MPTEFASTWLDAETKPSRELIEEALAISSPVSAAVMAKAA